MGWTKKEKEVSQPREKNSKILRECGKKSGLSAFMEEGLVIKEAKGKSK